MHPAWRMTALAIAVALLASPEPSRAGAPQPVAVDCNAGTLVIDKPGLYVLTDNTQNCALAPAIHITASNVVLDLGGRTLDGADQNGTTGIIAPGAKVVIRNGRVQDFGVGIALAGPKGVLDDVFVLSNVNQGIILNNGALVANCRSESNGGSGLEGIDGNLIRRSVFARNGVSGVLLGDRNVLVGNTASANAQDGFRLFDDNKLLQNVAAFNTLEGFEAGERSLFKNNTAASNGTFGILVSAQTSDGGGSRIIGNVVVGNVFGVSGEGTNLFEKNRAVANEVSGISAIRGTVKGNDASGNGFYGVIIGRGVVSKNTCTGNRVGIHANGGENTIVTANVANANTEDGIIIPDLAGANDTQIVKNVVIGNGQQGIDLPDGAMPVGKGKNTARGNLQSPQCDANLCRE